MNLSFSASNDGKSKWNKDGDKTITMHPEKEGLDLNALGYFHLRPDTELMIRGKNEVLKCTGSMDDITLSTSVAITFLVSSKIDLNVLYELCRDPEPWNVRISDAQEDLRSYEKALAYDFEAVATAKKDAQQKLGTDIENQSLAEIIVDTFGVEGAKEMVAAAREIVSGTANGKTYNINIDKPGGVKNHDRPYPKSTCENSNGCCQCNQCVCSRVEGLHQWQEVPRKT